MENQISANQTDNRVVVPYDKGRKNITFYDTFVDINGDVIKYDDIAVIQSSALNSSSMIYFYFDSSKDTVIPATESAHISASRQSSRS